MPISHPRLIGKSSSEARFDTPDLLLCFGCVLQCFFHMHHNDFFGFHTHTHTHTPSPLFRFRLLPLRNWTMSDAASAGSLLDSPWTMSASCVTGTKAVCVSAAGGLASCALLGAALATMLLLSSSSDARARVFFAAAGACVTMRSSSAAWVRRASCPSKGHTSRFVSKQSAGVSESPQN